MFELNMNYKLNMRCASLELLSYFRFQFKRANFNKSLFGRIQQLIPLYKHLIIIMRKCACIKSVFVGHSLDNLLNLSFNTYTVHA